MRRLIFFAVVAVAFIGVAGGVLGRAGSGAAAAEKPRQPRLTVFETFEREN